MFLTEAGCGLLALILCISGIRGQTHICALNGSLVTLNCSTPSTNLTSSSKWFSKQSNGSVLTEVSADERHAIHTSDTNQSTLTIKHVGESDAKVYCCGNDTNPCDQCSVQLRVTGLRVTVSHLEQGGHKVKLKCNTSCDLTEKPAAYIWYSDDKMHQEDKIFLYKHVSSSTKVQCGIQGSDKFKSPQVSLEHHNKTCVKVTRATGETCSLNKSDDCFTCWKGRRDVGTGTNPPSEPNHAHATAAVCAASAALLVVLPAVVFIWIRTRRTLQQLPTRGEGHVTPPLSSSDVYESVPAPPPQHDDVYYSTIVFQPKDSQRGTYAAVRFRPDV